MSTETRCRAEAGMGLRCTKPRWHDGPHLMERSAPSEPEGETPTLDEDAEQLRAFVRRLTTGGCRALSEGSACACMLCAVDRIAARAALSTEIGKLVEDAERFRWLSAGNECASLPSGRYTVWSGAADANFDGDSLRDAIDAARRVVDRLASGSELTALRAVREAAERLIKAWENGPTDGPPMYRSVAALRAALAGAAQHSNQSER